MRNVRWPSYETTRENMKNISARPHLRNPNLVDPIPNRQMIRKSRFGPGHIEFMKTAALEVGMS